MEEISIMQIKCPNCGAECETEGELIVGQHFICPFCSEKFAYDGVGQGNNAEENCHREVTTKYPHCGTAYEVDESLEGNTCQCSVCNKDFVVNVVQFVEVSGEHSSALTADEKEESKAYVSDKLAEEMNKATKAGNMQDAEIETVESGKPFLFKMKTVLITTKKKIIAWWKNGEEGRHLFFSKVKVTAIRTKDGVIAWWNGGKDGRYTLFCKAKATAISAKDKIVLLWNCGAKGKVAILGVAMLLALSIVLPLILQRSAKEDIALKDGRKIEDLRKAAEQGDPKAQFDLAFCYAGGDGVEQSKTEVAKWIRKSAEQGYSEAQCTLGILYANGVGVSADKSEAIKWIRKAAEQNHPLALCNLAQGYVAGDGVPQDLSEAVRLYRKSAELGLAEAQFQLGVVYAYGLCVAQDWCEAANWYRKAAEQGHSKAQLALGLCYQTGLGVNKNVAEASKWISESKKNPQLQEQVQDAVNFLKQFQ